MTKKKVYLDLSNLYIIKIAINEYWCNYSKTIYGENVKFYNMDADSFTLKVKSEDCQADLAENVETIFDTLNYEVNRPLSLGKSKKMVNVVN